MAVIGTAQALGSVSMPADVASGGLLKTRQTTVYHVGDDGDYEAGLGTLYDVLTTGQYALTSDIDVPHYANNGISFVAPSTVNDAGAGLVTVLAGDTVVVKGSALNDGVYTVAVGGVAGGFTVNEVTIVNEGAGPYVSLYKRAAHSNNCVFDRRTGLIWMRYASVGERVGAASAGTLVWTAAANHYSLHPNAPDLQMIAPATLRVVGGAAELTRYHAGDVVVCNGFANAVNNLPGYRVLAVTVNGANLDITLAPLNNVLVSEAAAGARGIRLVCRSIFGYEAAAKAVGLAGYSDWRVSNATELSGLQDHEAPNWQPDAVAFPGGMPNLTWSGTTYASATVNALDYSGTTLINVHAKTLVQYVWLVRGGLT